MPAHYDYLSFQLLRGKKVFTDFVEHVRGVATPAINDSGGEVLGLFQGQLGFASNEAVVLLRWPNQERGHLRELDQAPGVLTMHPEKLAPTIRPSDDAHIRAGGIYVHRWFSVDADSVVDFISLSNRAWTNFEGSYDTEIFGLFTAETTAADVRDRAGRLLLLTYYASHATWENSREQTRDPNGMFVKRHELTRSTIGRSSVLL